MKHQNESLTDIISALAHGTQTPIFLAEHSLARAAQLADLNAFAALDVQIVMAQAEAANQRRERGEALSPIDGIPIAIKDNYLTKDYPTTACSNAQPLEPAGQDAAIVANLRAAGAVIFGKTNMHEWAFGATNTTSSMGPTRNPHNIDHITGGSSGGSGAAVACGIVSAAFGSDTGGSIRIPSSACGIYGFKPSYGRASRHGLLPLSWSLDAPGPMGTSLQDLVHLMPYVLGADPADASTSHAEPFQAAATPTCTNVVNLSGAGLERSAEVDAAINDALSRSGASVVEASLQGVDQYFASWEAILHSEASSYHSALMTQNSAGFSPVTRAHLEAGTQITATELLTAQKIRARLMRALLDNLPDWDVLVLPTLPVPAPKHGDDWQEFGGRRVTTQDSMTWFCWLGNLAGLPCLTIPVGQSSAGLPIGMMLMGKPGRDEALLSAAKVIDQNVNNVV